MRISFLVGEALNREEYQPQITDAIQDTVQRGLIHDAANKSLAFREVCDSETIKPGRADKSFNPDLIVDKAVAVVHCFFLIGLRLPARQLENMPFPKSTIDL